MLLVVDDHDDSRQVLELLLKAEGYEAVGASCGHDALLFLKTNIPRLVILDYTMPDMVGLDVFREMRKDSRLKDVKVIMFSSHDGELRKEALSDSFELLSEIRSKAKVKSTPVVMFSADDQNLKQKALLKGADAYVPKGSLDWAELLTEIRRFAGPHPNG